MMKRLIALTAFGAGYVAGSAAGRERYEQIRGLFLQVKDDPRVQQKAHEAMDLAKAEAAPLRDKAAEAAGTVKDKLPGGGSGEHDHDGVTGDLGGGQYDPFEASRPS